MKSKFVLILVVTMAIPAYGQSKKEAVFKTARVSWCVLQVALSALVMELMIGHCKNARDSRASKIDAVFAFSPLIITTMSAGLKGLDRELGVIKRLKQWRNKKKMSMVTTV